MSEFPILDRCDEKAKTMPHCTIVDGDPLAVALVRHRATLADDVLGVNREKIEEAFDIADASKNGAKKTLRSARCPINSMKRNHDINASPAAQVHQETTALSILTCLFPLPLIFPIHVPFPGSY